MSKRIRMNGILYESLTDSDRVIAIRETLEDMDIDDLVEIWNNFCENGDGYDEDNLTPMGNFDDEFANISPLEIADMVIGCNFSSDDDYYYYTRNGNIASTSDPVDDGPIDLDSLVSYINKNNEAFGNSDLQDALDENPEEE